MITQARMEQAPKIVIIGAGPAGFRAAEEILKRQPDATLSLIGNESSYNRVQLSALLAHEVGVEQIFYQPLGGERHPNFQHIQAHIVEIDRSLKRLTDQQGQHYHYDKLILATGAKPHVPQINGTDLDGVLVFRSLRDTERLQARLARARHIAVVGGGLLGLEAARALRRNNTQVTIIQQGPWLMNRQLDHKAAARLRASVEALGITVIENAGVREISGLGRVEQVHLHRQQHLEVDTVVLCSGIRINHQLAKQALLKVAKGILVDRQLTTSDPDIFAIGECCEFEGQCFGLVEPGLEQAAIVADTLAGGSAEYRGSLNVSRLKVVGEQVCSIGDIHSAAASTLAKVLTFEDSKHYRKVVLHNGRITAAIGIGEWPEFRQIREAILEQRPLRWWQGLRFANHGRLWPEQQDSPQHWPEQALICQCNRVSRGQLSTAISAGACSIEQLQQQTQAATVCGSCKPLLTQLLTPDNQAARLEKEQGSNTLTLASLLACCIALLMLLVPGLQPPESVQQNWRLDKIWNDGFYKQVSGFTLLGLTLLGLGLSLRKRFKFKLPGDFNYWRLAHGLIGVVCVAILVAHTGLHLGSNLNRFLVLNFLAVLLLGSLTGLSVAQSHQLPLRQAKGLRQWWSWLHILISWPLPILLAVHVLSVYYF
ncbi:FAD-dependent oxidoreductase [Aliagarivorans marinus]|uniref:FAD-dependent oxidoreductase n=1 Tax=Aliagarivorans marinus TaxID=561965 RepID=UPI0003F8B2C7|nr:FAD-dependent oxidoreductase [Aliagarivorans marinus]